ncbi:hypothetical protein GDO86_003967 [Hymenochirus boettgeri]|uniref:Ig-like domain-containing protein n=1 Tax=Hymenochirus boettgeri TaxID=247094 RepID=A0A8T2KBJ3_9PIPI|nr:hypothetical protein GDO86_003967 [Hymenochirus boettgeri]
MFVTRGIGQVPVWGQLHKDVILPCSFIPGEDEKIEKRDANLYVCYVGTFTSKHESTVKLNIAAFEENFIDYDAKTHRLRCTSKNAFPSDAVNSTTWYTGNNLDTEINSPDGYLDIGNSFNMHKCIIHHSILNINWTGIWKMRAPNLTENEDVKLECERGKILGSNFSVTWLWRKNFQSNVIATTNNLSEPFNITEHYKNRTKYTAGKAEITVKHLRMEDSGEYICDITTPDRTNIYLTSINVTQSNHRMYECVFLY